MKISQDMIDAALDAYSACTNDLDGLHRPSMTRALEAALRVRKARKAAKREKGKPIDMDEMLRVHAEWDKQVETGINLSDTNSSVGNTTTPKPLTIEAGKSYRTRDGRKAVILSRSKTLLYGQIGEELQAWYLDGTFYLDRDSDDDLIAEWQE